MQTLKTIGCLFTAAVIGLGALSGPAFATTPPAGEEGIFTSSTDPDALIVLDLSGSMEWNPAGGGDVYGNSSCSGTFYSSSGSGHTTNCSRLNIAKRTIFDVLDDNDDSTIDSSDETSLSVRMGYMRYYNCSDSSDEQVGTYSYDSGCNKYTKAIGSKYSQIYCGSNTSCTVSTNYGTSSSSYVSNAPATGGTPLAIALHEAKLYLDAHKAGDSAASCRKKFVILITDGSDTYACSGDGSECDGGRYKNRRESVARAKALADAGYKVFVIGFGSSMPDYLEKTLNWMAYYGGTDNPDVANAGSTSGYTPGTAGACTAATDAATATCYDSSGSHSIANFKANTSDPGYIDLSGYAFLAADADQLATALKTAVNIIRQANYSFSQSSVQSARTSDENYLYEGSFEPADNEPFWKGHLKKFAINSDGTVGSMLLDAGTVLQGTSAGSRTIYTYKGSALTSFTTSNITYTDLALTTDAQRDLTVGFIRGESTYNIEDWKLGDVFRSTPITVGTPSSYFDDIRDANNRFADHRTNHPRTSANGNRLIVAGTNAGTFHAFKTSNMTEAWSFIPPNLLSKLKNIAHNTHPTALTHQYFVDGPVTVADAWLGSGDGTVKDTSSTNSWATVLVFGLGRGNVNYGWSSSTSCDSGINSTYSTTYPYYCGFWAFNLNSSLSPAFLWRLNPTAAQAPYMGDAWSKMMVGRVRIYVSGAEQEKWVGFIGAGYSATDCKGGGTCDTRGKAFYVVDLSNGSILWSYTNGATTTTTTHADMDYSLPAQPSIVDTDNDGFIDTAYIGDLGGNLWRFRFCRYSDMSSSCGTSNWTGGLFFDSSTGSIRPIYTSAAVAKDVSGNVWVYWGTGDKTDPTASNAQEHFYGVKDNFTSTYSVSNIDNITTDTGTYDGSSGKVGYRIQLTGGGQKILADPTVFGGVVYFTTYTPGSGSNPCEQGGTSYLYGVKYTSGAGALSGGARTMSVGSGIASSPVVSLRPGAGTPDLYVTTSGGGGSSASTARVNFNPPGVANRTNMIYWKDNRIQ